MLEEHLYWVLVLERWVYTDLDDILEIYNQPLFGMSLPKSLRKFLLKRMVLPKLQAQSHGQGMGRHSKEDVVTMGK